MEHLHPNTCCDTTQTHTTVTNTSHLTSYIHPFCSAAALKAELWLAGSVLFFAGSVAFILLGILGQSSAAPTRTSHTGDA
jgi:hypothetical protein